MAQLLVSQLINAPIEAVWPWISDINKHSQWSPKPYSVELVSGVDGEVGSKYRSTGWVPPADKNHRNDVEITEVIPKSKIVLMAHDENGFYKNTFTLESVGQGTQVTFQNVFPQMKGMGRILVPILLPIVGKKDVVTRLRLLKAKAEGK